MRAKWAKKRMRRRQRKKRKMKKWAQTTPQGVNSTCRTIWSWACEWGALHQWIVLADSACSSEFGVCASAARASVVLTFLLKYKLESSWWHSIPFPLCFPHLFIFLSPIICHASHFNFISTLSVPSKAGSDLPSAWNPSWEMVPQAGFFTTSSHYLLCY